MAKPSSQFKFDKHPTYKQLLKDGAKEIITEVVTVTNEDGIQEHEIQFRATFTDRPDSVHVGCPRPCPMVEEA